MTRRFTGLITLALALLSAPQAQAAGGTLHLDSAKVTLNGTSNVHPYEATTTTVTVMKVKVSPAIAGEVDGLASAGVIEAFDIAIPVKTLTSPKDGIDKNMHKALKADQFADITFCLTRLERGTAPGAFRGIGRLTIAGVEKEVALDLTVQRSGASLTVTGALALLMTDYGITPPKAMLGMLKTDPKVTIAFETVLSVPVA
ncbi:MAG TPA: YceI family protein [Vicinamibacterales bacterium]|jgi:polyisoprenoid-binding protein YceI|nr:YceI family protein [Vicinamibacterales bacterium]